MTYPFTHVINPQQNLNALKQEIFNLDKNFFTFDFNHAINSVKDNDKISIDDFWKLAKIKAKKVSLFVDEITSCHVIEEAPLGFIREITMSGTDITQGMDAEEIRIKERVIVDDNTKTLLFFQLQASGKVLLFAINTVAAENSNVYFTGHYVYSIKKDSTAEDEQAFMLGSNEILPERVSTMIDNMKKFYYAGKLNEVYRQLYG